MSETDEEAGEDKKPQRSAYEKLTSRYRRFVDYIVEGKTGSDAARLSGCKGKRPTIWASIARTKPEVRAAIAEREAEAIREAGRTVAEILRVVGNTMDRCRQATPVLDKLGNPVLVETANGQLAPAYVFDAKNALKAAEMLGDYHKIWTQKHEITGKDGEPLQAAAPVLHLTLNGDVEPSDRPVSATEAEPGVP